MNLVGTLRSASLPLAVVLVGLGLALLERHQTKGGARVEIYGANRVPQLEGDQLERLARQALELAPETAQANFWMATALADRGRLRAARPHLEKALDVDRRDPYLLLLFARVLEAQREDPATIEAIHAELRRYFPQDWEVMKRYLEPGAASRPSDESRPSREPG